MNTFVVQFEVSRDEYFPLDIDFVSYFGKKLVNKKLWTVQMLFIEIVDGFLELIKLDLIV